MVITMASCHYGAVPFNATMQRSVNTMTCFFCAICVSLWRSVYQDLDLMLTTDEFSFCLFLTAIQLKCQAIQLK